MTTATKELRCEDCNRTQEECGEMTGIIKRLDGSIRCDACQFVKFRHVWGL